VKFDPVISTQEIFAMRFFNFSLLSLALVGCFTFSATAQEFPKPTAEHEAIKELEGTWDATMKMDGGSFPGVMKAKMDLGGLWLVSDYESDFGGLKFSGKGLDSYDPAKKKFVSVWVDSMSTTPMVLEGDYDKASETLVMTGKSKNMEGKAITVKTVSKMKGKDEHGFEMFEIGDDGKEKSMFTIDYKRKK
jgi:hypothetical protein